MPQMNGILNMENIPTFEVITAVLLRIQVFREVTPYHMSGTQHV
jgi:hypothetical protein